MKKRILLISSYAGISQGQNHNVYNIAKELRLLGSAVFIATCEDPHKRKPGDQVELVIKRHKEADNTYIVPCILGSELKDLDKRAGAKIRNIANEIISIVKPEIVWMHHRSGIEWLYLYQMSDAKHMLTIHDAEIACPKRTRKLPEGNLCFRKKSDHECVQCISREQSKAGRLNQKALRLRVLNPLITAIKLLANKISVLRYTLTIEDQLLDEKVEWARLKNEAIIKRSDIIIAPTQAMKELVEDQHAKNDKIKVVPWGIRTKEGDFSVADQMHPQETILIGYVGRFSKEKGILTLLDGLDGINTDCDKRILVKLWGNSDDDSFMGLCRSKGQANASRNKRLEIDFPGWTDSVDDALRSIDILVIPSDCWENSPLIAHEAANIQGLSVVCSDIPGLRETLGGSQCGTYYFEMGNAISLRSALSRCIAGLKSTQSFAARKRPLSPRDHVLRSLEALDAK